MANKRESEKFMPVVAIPPGESIRENMIYLGMDQEELAARLGITPKHLSNIINGNASLTHEMAIKLEDVIGPSAEFWMNLENDYQITKARIENESKLDKDLDILKKIPYLAMSEYGWVPETNDRKLRVRECREFFGVASLDRIEASYGVMFRKQKLVGQVSDYGILAWLRKAEIEGLKSKVKKFNKVKLRGLIPYFRKLTLEEPEVFYPEIQRLCAECGVALVLVEYLPKTAICGATIWRGDKAIVALSLKGKKADIFWFTFFHEIAHLITHPKKLYINYEKNGECGVNKEEVEADKIASEWLISNEDFNNFLELYDYRKKEDIIRYSNAIDIAPCILVGRLMHEKIIDYNYHHDLRPSFVIKRTH